MATEEGKQMVLSVTQSDGTNVKYLIKLPQVDRLEDTAKAKEAVAKEKVSSWELERLGTAVASAIIRYRTASRSRFLKYRPTSNKIDPHRPEDY